MEYGEKEISLCVMWITLDHERGMANPFMIALRGGNLRVE
jgi:hypothetical protein